MVCGGVGKLSGDTVTPGFYPSLSVRLKYDVCPEPNQTFVAVEEPASFVIEPSFDALARPFEADRCVVKDPWWRKSSEVMEHFERVVTDYNDCPGVRDQPLKRAEPPVDLKKR